MITTLLSSRSGSMKPPGIAGRYDDHAPLDAGVLQHARERRRRERRELERRLHGGEAMVGGRRAR